MLIVFLGSDMILGLDLHLTNLKVWIFILKCCCKATYLILLFLSTLLARSISYAEMGRCLEINTDQ